MNKSPFSRFNHLQSQAQKKMGSLTKQPTTADLSRRSFLWTGGWRLAYLAGYPGHLSGNSSFGATPAGWMYWSLLPGTLDGSTIARFAAHLVCQGYP